MSEEHDGLSPDPEFRAAILAGLGRRPRRIPCRFLYDRQGSALFEQICGLEEYYLTRTEHALLYRHAGDLRQWIGPRPRILEFGGCTPGKARYLFDALDPTAYLPVDICREALAGSVAVLRRDYPELSVHPIHADFTRPIPVPQGAQPMLGFFPGSTIGNMRPAGAIAFLRRVRRVLGKTGAMLIGVDLKKDPALLHAAYNDSRGITAAFILNLIGRINRELDGDFDLGGYAHAARYNAAAGRVELHIVSLRDQVARAAGAAFHFLAGDRIHTEDSHKYSVEEFQALARRAGFDAAACWRDEDDLFSIHLLTVPD
jgi:dimethylhistidine N-methyltransferase